MKEQLTIFLKDITSNWKQRRIKEHSKFLEYLNGLYPDTPLGEQIFLFENNIDKRPYCSCGKELWFRYDRGYSETCSKTCMGLSRQSSDKWKTVQDKAKVTMVECYGAENAFASEIVKEKIKKSNLKKYGVEHPAQNLEILEKMKHTNLIRYGTIEGPINSEENLKRYRRQSFKRLEKLSESITILDKIPQDIKYTDVYGSAHPDLVFLCNKCNNTSTTNYMTYLNRCGAFGTPCPFCSKVTDRGSSFGERELAGFVKSIEPNVVMGDRILIAPKELDIVIPDKKIAIEYNGLYYHSNDIRDKNYHIGKLNAVNKAGYRLISIFEDEWIFKKEIVKQRLSHILGHTNGSIAARQCVVNILTTKEAKDFIERHHIQGNGHCHYRYGLFHNDLLVAVMTFSLPSAAKGMRHNTDPTIIELNRYCSSMRVHGAAGKLLAAFCRDYPEYHTIYSFADLRWSNGNLYRQLGFQLDYQTKPNYWYVKGKERIYRYGLRKNKNDDPNLTEMENRARQGYRHIWDCGNLKFSYTNPHYIKS